MFVKLIMILLVLLILFCIVLLINILQNRWVHSKSTKHFKEIRYKSVKNGITKKSNGKRKNK